MCFFGFISSEFSWGVNNQPYHLGVKNLLEKLDPVETTDLAPVESVHSTPWGGEFYRFVNAFTGFLFSVQ